MRFSSTIRWYAILVVAAAAWSANPLYGDELADARRRLTAEHRKQLVELAGWCQDQDLAKQAATARGWLLPRHARVRYVYLPTAEPGSLKAPADAPANVTEWHGKFAKLRVAQAEKLFELAKQANEAGQVSLAFELANEALRENPDDEPLRKIFALDTNVGTKSRKLASSWKIDTEHFSITTNHSEKAGAALGQRLELLYDVWWQVFAGYRLTKTQRANLFNKGVRPLDRKYAVTYFRNKDDYRNAPALRGELPENVTTTGMYLSSKRSSYFFHTEDADDGTVFHEVTHQLFGESPRVVRNVGRASDFWIIEGIACYMESLTEHAGYVTLGGVDAIRTQDARYYLFKKDFFIPAAELTRLGMLDLQRHKQIGRVYAQSAAVADFLMHAEDGRYRDGLIEYIAKVYQGRRATLPAIVGMPSKELDKMYKDYQRVSDEDLALLPRASRVTYLTLGGSRVSDAGLAKVKDLKTLQWIDLYKTKVTDAGLAHLAGLPKLLQLDLSATKISDAGLKHLAKVKQLQNLMLGATPVTDRGLQHLAGLQQLTQLVLWNTNLTDDGLAHLSRLNRLQELDLSGTLVSDAGLRHLRGLRGLKTLDLSDTKVTAEGVRSLQQALPDTKIKR